MDIARSTPGAFGWTALATALLSFSVLSFEVALTRIFSVMLSYHFVFAIVSFALLGLGLGGALLKPWRSLAPWTRPSGNATLAAVSMAGATLFIIMLPIYDRAAWIDLRLWLYLFLSTVPFFFAGLTLADLFRAFAARSSVLYGFDLLGAALGILSVVALLSVVHGTGAALIAATAAAFAALLLAVAERRSRAPQIMTGAVVSVVLVAVLLGRVDVPVAMDPGKDLYRFLNNPLDRAEVVESRWSAFGRTDLVRSRQAPDQLMLFIDGAAGSAMFNLDSLMASDERQAVLARHLGLFFPFYFLEDHEKDSVLVIGPGGGRDVVVALLGGARSITAVEVNPEVVRLMQDYAGFNGGLYSGFPGVRVVVQEGRNYLRTTDERYDLIMMALPVTKSSRSVEGYALTENYLFTVEAFEEYLDRLTPEGRLVIMAHHETEIYRLIVLALSAFRNRGLSESAAMNHLYTVASMMPTLVIAKAPFDSLAAQQRHALLHELGYDQGSYFIPRTEQVRVEVPEDVGYEDEWYMFDQALVDLSTGRFSLEELVGSALVDLRPVTDDRPFFYLFDTGLPSPFGVFSVLILLVICLVAVPLAYRRRSDMGRPGLLRSFAAHPCLKGFLIVFFLLGVGFMLVEIALFQKLTLYLGQPTLALTVLLFSLLLGTGLGSLASGFVRKHLAYAILASTLAVLVLVSVYGAVLPNLFASTRPAPVTAFLVLLPLGAFMGFPFPLSIRLMEAHQLDRYVDGMWGINGIASVVGSGLAMITGLTLGFSYALLFGAIAYGSVALLVGILHRSVHQAGNLKEV